MIYFLILIGFFGSVGFFIALYNYLFRSQKLGYLKYILLMFIYATAILPVIFYASVGSLYSWYKAVWIYEHLGWIYLAQILIVMLVYICTLIVIKTIEWKN